MTEIEFEALSAQGYNRSPVSLEPFAYLLESVQGGERFGRYSIIGLAATTRIVVRADEVLVLTGNRIAERDQGGNPLSFIEHYMARFKAPEAKGLPRLLGGLV